VKIQFWKWRREIEVLLERLLYYPYHLLAPFLQKLYDYFWFGRLQYWTAAGCKNSKGLAIVLSYSTRGISPSVYRTVRRLNRLSLHVLVVCNGGAKQIEIDKLKTLEASYLLRPNWGYDFGGYRDALRLLDNLQVKPDELILMNDSIEYPVLSGDDLIHSMRASGCDFVGAIHAKPHRVKAATEVGVIFSFFLWASARTIQSDTWRIFWHSYVMTGSKYATVRRGERALSQTMLTSRLVCKGIYTRDKFMEKAKQLDADELRIAIEYGVFVDDEAFLKKAAELLETVSEDWPVLALDFITMVVAKRNFLYSFPYITHRHLKVPFLKRGSSAAQLAAYKTFYRMEEQGLIPNLCARTIDSDEPRQV